MVLHFECLHNKIWMSNLVPPPLLHYSTTPILPSSDPRYRHMYQRVSVTRIPESRPISPDGQIDELPLKRIKSNDAIKSF
jgi:hypothetical protein